MSIFRLFIFIPFLLVSSGLAADKGDKIAIFYRNFKAKLDAEASKLDKNFFKKVFQKSDIPLLFEQVLEEEHALLPQVIISQKVRNLSVFPGQEFVDLDQKVEMIQSLSRENPSYFKASSTPLEVWKSLISLNEPFRSFNEEQQMELLMYWRELFRNKVQDHVAYLAGIKPWYSYSLTSVSAYDSNVNRTPDDNTNTANFSGMDDFQQTTVLSFNWKPLANNKKFTENWSFTQSFSAIHILQSAHKENTLAILNVEPKLTRNLNGFFNSASLAYRYHNFYFDANTDTTDPENSYVSRDVQAYFNSHRLKLELNSKRYGAYKWINGQSTGVSLSYEFRNHADDTLNNEDSENFILGLSQTFYYGSRNDSVKVSLDYSNYTADSADNREFFFFNPKLNLTQRFDLGWKHPITFKENISYRYKKWEDYLATGSLTEELTTFGVSASTQLLKGLLMSLGLSQTFRDAEEESVPVTETNADQFKASVSFTWFQ